MRTPFKGYCQAASFSLKSGHSRVRGTPCRAAEPVPETNLLSFFRNHQFSDLRWHQGHPFGLLEFVEQCAKARLG
jgi:hypothetical protein